MVLARIETPPKGVPKGAAAEGAALGRANADAILRTLHEHGPASAGTVGAADGLSAVSVRGHLHRMEAEGLVTKTGTRWSLTPAGIARTGPTTSAADVAAVFDRLPSEPHRAMARLIRDAMVARFHHAERGAIGWPGFALWGPPGSCKTTVPRVLGRLVGLPDYESVRVVSDLDRAELLGRRVPDGKGSYRFAPAPALGSPVLGLDEMDKARGETRDLALRILQGDGVIALEGERIVVRASPVVTFNGGRDPRDVLPSDRLRRTVLFYTGAVSLADCARAARELFDRGPLPVLDLARLAPPEPGDDGPARFFADDLPRFLSPAALAFYPGHGLSLIVAGRMAVEGHPDQETAAVAIGQDYLTLAATWGGTTAVAAARYQRHHGGDAPETADESVVAAIAVDERSEAVELAEVRAVLAEAVALERREIGQAEDAEAVALRAGLAEISRQFKAARTMAEVDQVGGLWAGLQGRARRRAEVEAGRRLAALGTGTTHRSARTRTVAPDRSAYLTELARVGSREAPGPVLASLGLAEPDPLPTGRGRWHGTTPELRGAVVFDTDSWADPAVRAILIDARDRQPATAGPPALLASP